MILWRYDSMFTLLSATGYRAGRQTAIRWLKWLHRKLSIHLTPVKQVWSLFEAKYLCEIDGACASEIFQHF
jgi:hypothetical protein